MVSRGWFGFWCDPHARFHPRAAMCELGIDGLERPTTMPSVGTPSPSIRALISASRWITAATPSCLAIYDY